MSLPLKELINYGKTQLERAGIEDADRDARGLYCFLDRLDSVGLMMHWQDVLQDNQCEAYFELIERRAAGEPFQYITCLLYTSCRTARLLWLLWRKRTLR